MEQLRNNVFIISSTESLPVARAVKEALSTPSVVVDVWDENIFALNRGVLDELLNRASYYDFAVAIFSADDETRMRGHEIRSTRDNVIFEFGLFLGRLGLDRSFFLLEDGVELFSDWEGRVVATYSPRDNLRSAVGNACYMIRDEIMNTANLYPLLPSTALAIGYYRNFLARVFEGLETTGHFEIQRKDKDGQLIPGTTTYSVGPGRPEIRVRIPENLADLQPGNLRRLTSSHQQVLVTSRFRTFPFYVEGDYGDDGNLILFDVPTTLLTARHALEKIFDERMLRKGSARADLERREINNFKRVVLSMMDDDIENTYFSFVDWHE